MRISDPLLAARWESMVEQFETGDIDGCIESLQRLADDGFPAAMIELGVIYETAPGSRAPDMDAAIMWYEKAARAGSLDGELSIARLHLTGIGVPTDYDLARKTYERIIDSGEEDPRALFGLGWIYHQGFGVRQDMHQAARYYRRASRVGHLLAAKWLANVYWAQRIYLRAVVQWLLAIAKIWWMTIRHRDSMMLHRQL